MTSTQRVWRRFERTLKDGSLKKFRIQEIPPDMYEDVWEFILKYFIPDEPFSIFNDVLSHPDMLARSKNFWTTMILPKNYSVMCVEDLEYDSKPEIVGINNLLIEEAGKKEKPNDLVPSGVSRTLDVLYGDFDVFKHFGVEKYLGACGMAVSSKYRGMNIGLEILLAREPLCKHYGLKVTETVFTAAASQALAKKAGFETIFEKTYAELGELLDIKIPEEFKMCKVMAKVYD